MKILDTDACIEILRGNPHVLERRHATPDRVATTWITACELAYGATNFGYPDKNRTLVTEFLSTLPILDLDLPGALLFGRHKTRLHLPKGQPWSRATPGITIASRACRWRTGYADHRRDNRPRSAESAPSTEVRSTVARCDRSRSGHAEKTEAHIGYKVKQPIIH